ncbi:hypothetical protein BDZ94DRAFT_152752 [Collybia nuda]|uniref:Uncharacterized protein n=1 Tax=Collybia nuda TaxID=64659 RepID=A0A9P6CA48_9AGAR|nr:hypothetical protein BDZ94DRAFT_152752 [Collybia nuda]
MSPLPHKSKHLRTGSFTPRRKTRDCSTTHLESRILQIGFVESGGPHFSSPSGTLKPRYAKPFALSNSPCRPILLSSIYFDIRSLFPLVWVHGRLYHRHALTKTSNPTFIYLSRFLKQPSLTQATNLNFGRTFRPIPSIERSPHMFPPPSAQQDTVPPLRSNKPFLLSSCDFGTYGTTTLHPVNDPAELRPLSYE